MKHSLQLFFTLLISLVSSISAQDLKCQPVSCNDQGVTFMNAGDYTAAIRYFNRAVELEPGYAIAYYNLGSGYAVIKDFKNA